MANAWFCSHIVPAHIHVKAEWRLTGWCVGEYLIDC